MIEHLLDGVLVRAATYVALALCLGPIVWAWCSGLEGARRLGRARAIAVGVLVGFAIVLAVVQATLTFAERWSWSAALAVLRDTDYGHRVLWFAAACLVHGLALLRGGGTLAATSAIVMLAIARLGHAALGTSVDVAIHALHTLAVVAWLGGLVTLTQHVAARTAELTALLRFSSLAAGLVVIVVASGVARVLAVADELRITAWSVALAVKLLAFAAALWIALGHRRTRIPALRTSPAAWPRMEVMLTLELWLVLCALVLAGLLSQLEPP